MNEPIGLLGSLIPLLDLIIASLTKCKASSCPITLCFIACSRFNSFSFSLLTNLLSGILVHLEMIAAISSSSTWSLSNFLVSLLFNSSSSFSRRGKVPCLNLAAVSKSYLFSACSKSNLAFSISFFLFCILV